MFARKALHPHPFCVKKIDTATVGRKVLRLPTTADHLRTYCGTPL